MQTVNFQCGHCGRLMAVSTEFLGQQVRCPHCQQIVMAPTTTASAPTIPPASSSLGQEQTSFSLSSRNEQDSIFGPPEASDDLFGGSSGPRLDLFKSEPPPAPTLDQTVHLNPSAPSPPAAPPAGSETVAYRPGGLSAPAVPEPFGQAEATTAFLPSAPPLPQSSALEPGTASSGMTPEEEQLPTPPRRRPAPSGSRTFVMLILLLPLVSYAIIATVLLVLLWNKLQAIPPNPFDQLPDIEGDNPGAKRVGVVKKATWTYKQAFAVAPLPEELKIGLNQPLTLGDLQITPLRVERKKVKIYVENFDKPSELANESLVLHLRLKNLSDTYAFTPLDNYFDRRWKGQGTPPLTVLEVGKNQFFGGPAEWYNWNRSKKQKELTRREWLEGRKNYDEEGLLPGQTMETFVCTDGNQGQEHIPQALDIFKGDLLYRIHLRRGLVMHRKKEYSATAVIGVKFTDQDIKRIDN